MPGELDLDAAHPSVLPGLARDDADAFGIALEPHPRTGFEASAFVVRCRHACRRLVPEESTFVARARSRCAERLRQGVPTFNVPHGLLAPAKQHHGPP